MSRQAFRALLEAGDVEGLRAWYRAHAPNMPQPDSCEAAEIVMHRARTDAASISLRSRAYSHAWLCERALPSGLPDALRPRAERLYSVTALAVGISVNFRSAYMKGAETEVRGAMESAVLEAQADGLLGDARHVAARMAEAKASTMKALFGRDLP